VRERERLIARIRQIRRVAKSAEPAERVTPVTSDPPEPQQQQLAALEARLTHLEALVQGLQDSVHREASRNAKRLTELEARVQPAALGKALEEDVRARGL
jgi:TolA-binding protein